MSSQNNPTTQTQMEVLKDEVQIEVNRIWNEEPGIGVKDLMKKLESLNLSSSSSSSSSDIITKQRVKAAKQAVPYTYIRSSSTTQEENDNGNDNDDNGADFSIKKSFVEQKIQERTSVRSLRRYKEADEIGKGLAAMGIELNDGMKTWTIIRAKKVSDANGDADHHDEMKIMAQQKSSTGVACQFCGRYFASKNLVFRHLRDVSTSCGNSIFAKGQKLPEAPSTAIKRQKQETNREIQKALRRKKTGKARERSDPAATLWFGDLPIPYTRLGGQYKRLRAVLREYLPRDVPQPWIKKVVRKAYRKHRKGGKRMSEDENESNEHHEDNNERGEYLGYAIIVFRDAEEANNVKEAMDGIQIEAKKALPAELSLIADYFSSFEIKVKNDENENDKDKVVSEDRNNDSLHGFGQDPPLLDQLRPLSTAELQERCQFMRERIERGDVVDAVLFEHGTTTDTTVAKTKTDHPTLEGEESEDEKKSEDHNNASSQEHDQLLQLASSFYKAIGPSRPERHHKGRIIPESIRDNLHHLLKNVRWPAASHRKGLTSDHYLVLQTNVANERFYNDLRIGCRELMDWADPDYYYSGIAVTKNFVASPHIDDRDQSFQYAVSIGDFEEGGELCVEGNYTDEDEDEDDKKRVDYVNVVETRNRIARVDGRNVHWVRTWNGADRYSLIFYDTTNRHTTEKIEAGVDLAFLSK